LRRVERLSQKAKDLSSDTYALYFAARDPRVPWLAKLVAGLVVAYAVSPIDLIPDFIPVLGMLDDLIIVPLGLSLALRMIPREIMDEHRETARKQLAHENPRRWIGVLIVIGVWALIAALVLALVSCAPTP
jgi:uncharacterized membrane protein YkvA (DUF1232 family)